MRKLVVFLLAVLLLINTGCKLTESGIFTAPKLDKNKITVIDDSLDGKTAEQSNLDAEISAYLEKEAAFKSIGGTAFEVHELYGTEQRGEKTLAYIWSRMQEYAVYNGKLTEGSGYSMPLVVELKEKEDGSFEALKYEAPADGDRYVESVKKCFLPNIRIKYWRGQM